MPVVRWNKVPSYPCQPSKGIKYRFFAFHRSFDLRGDSHGSVQMDLAMKSCCCCCCSLTSLMLFKWNACKYSQGSEEGDCLHLTTVTKHLAPSTTLQPSFLGNQQHDKCPLTFVLLRGIRNIFCLLDRTRQKLYRA